MSGNERECQAALDALTECFADLVEAAIPLKWLSRYLFTLKIITLDQLEEADSHYTGSAEKERRQTLLTILLRKVKYDVKCFYDFVNALKNEPAHSKYVEGIETAYKLRLEQLTTTATIPDPSAAVPIQPQTSSSPQLALVQANTGPPPVAQAQGSSGTHPPPHQDHTSSAMLPKQAAVTSAAQMLGSSKGQQAWMPSGAGLVPLQFQASCGTDVALRRQSGQRAKKILLNYAKELPGQLQNILTSIKGDLVQEGIIDNDAIDLSMLGVSSRDKATSLYSAIVNFIESNPGNFPKLVDILKSYTTLSTVADELKQAGKEAGLFGDDVRRTTQPSTEDLPPPDGGLPLSDLGEVFRELDQISEVYQFGLHLGLRPGTLDRIEADNFKVESRLRGVVKKWLERDYMVNSYGVPTWESLCKAVHRLNPALAMSIRKRRC